MLTCQSVLGSESFENQLLLWAHLLTTRRSAVTYSCFRITSSNFFTHHLKSICDVTEPLWLDYEEQVKQQEGAGREQTVPVLRLSVEQQSL